MTDAEFALLSLLAEQPRHGYQIENVIEERGMREWTEIGFSSIYYLLKKLEKDGQVISSLAPPAGKGPSRRVYKLTQAGYAAWQEATLEALSVPKGLASPFLMGLSNYPTVPPDQALTALRSYRQALAERQERILSRAGDQQPLPPHIEAMFDYSRALLEAEIAWFDRFIHQVETQS